MIVLSNIVHIQASNFINCPCNGFYSYFPLHFGIPGSHSAFSCHVPLDSYNLKLFFVFLDLNIYRMFLNFGLSDVYLFNSGFVFLAGIT